MKNNILKNMTILYVEDEQNIRENVTFYLENIFKIVITAKDGQDGYNKFLNNKDNIDIIISDINMPFMDGLKMISYIKKVSHNIPIILTTAYTDNEYLMESINLGVTNYLVKPIDIDNLISLISKACTIRYEEKEIKKIVDKMSKNNFNNISDFFHKFHEFLDEATCIYKLTDNITYDVSTKMIIKNDEQITLNNQEVIVLEHLLKHKDKIIKYETLLNQMSKTEEASIATLRTIIKQLRNKIDKSIIKNVSKIGYKVSIKI